MLASLRQLAGCAVLVTASACSSSGGTPAATAVPTHPPAATASAAPETFPPRKQFSAEELKAALIRKADVSLPSTWKGSLPTTGKSKNDPDDPAVTCDGKTIDDASPAGLPEATVGFAANTTNALEDDLTSFPTPEKAQDDVRVQGGQLAACTKVTIGSTVFSVTPLAVPDGCDASFGTRLTGDVAGEDETVWVNICVLGTVEINVNEVATRGTAVDPYLMTEAIVSARNRVKRLT